MYDGGGYTISGIRMNGSSGASYLGMFGRTKDSVIKNLTLNDVSINYAYGYNSVSNSAALIGYATDTTVSNVTVSNATVIGQKLIGIVSGSAVNSCVIKDVTVKDSYFSASRLSGGIAGQILLSSAGSKSEVSNIKLYNVSTAIRNSESNGLTKIEANNLGTATVFGNIYATSASTLSVGKIEINDSLVVCRSSGSLSSKPGEQGAFLAGSIYSKVSDFNLNFNSAIVINNSSLDISVNRDVDAFGLIVGKIYTGKELICVLPMVDISDTKIDYSGSVDSGGATNLGTYCGQVDGKTVLKLPDLVDFSDVSYLWNTGVSDSEKSNIGGAFGLIGEQAEISSVNGISVVRHAGADGYYKADGGTLGGFAGKCLGKVSNISVRNFNTSYSTLLISSSETGGFVGLAVNADIKNCDVQNEAGYGISYVRGYGNTGGFAGSFSGTALNCFSAENVLGEKPDSDYIPENSSSGGFAGVINSADVKNSYSSASVSGYSACGGFAGKLSPDNSIVSVDNCYSTGDVNGNAEAACGGFAGFVGISSMVSNSYSLGKVSNAINTSDDFGGFFGVTDLDFSKLCNDLELMRNFAEAVKDVKVDNRANAGQDHQAYYETDENGDFLYDDDGNKILNTSKCLGLFEYLKLSKISTDSTAANNVEPVRNEDGSAADNSVPIANVIVKFLNEHPEIAEQLDRVGASWSFSYDEEYGGAALYWTYASASYANNNRAVSTYKVIVGNDIFEKGSCIMKYKNSFTPNYYSIEVSTWIKDSDVTVAGILSDLFENDAYLYSGPLSYNNIYKDYNSLNSFIGIDRLDIKEFKTNSFSAFTKMTAAENSYPYPAIPGAGAGNIEALHIGNWPDFTDVSIPRLNEGSNAVGFFRYSKTPDGKYNIEAACTQFDLSENSSVLSFTEIPDLLSITADL